MAAMICKVEIDQTDLHETLALVRQIEASALRAQAALASLAPAADSAGEAGPEMAVICACGLVSDETPELILAELRGLREEAKALRADIAKTALDTRRLSFSGEFKVIDSSEPDPSFIPTYNPETKEFTYPAAK